MTRTTRISLTRLTVALAFLVGLAGCATSSTTPESEARQITTLDGTPVLYKTEPPATYFFGEYELPANEIREQTRPLAEKVAVAAVKRAKLDIVGPLTLFLPDWSEQTSGEVSVGVGYQVTGSGQLVPQFEQDRKAGLAHLSVTLPGGEDNTATWEQLYRIADEQNMAPNGDNRAVISPASGGYQVELQLGLR
jgi:hypothetical protein